MEPERDSEGWVIPSDEDKGRAEVLRRALIQLGVEVYEEPFQSYDHDGTITFEWWCYPRKLTIYFEPGYYWWLRVWGPHIFEDMEEGGTGRDEGITESVTNVKRQLEWLYQEKPIPMRPKVDIAEAPPRYA